MIERMDRCIPDLDHFDFKLDQYNRAMLNSTFEQYKYDIRQVFNLFQDLLASLPHVPERQQRQWDIASFVAATAALTLSMHNTVQISKLETAIEAQKQKTDLLADIVKLHEQHLHQLDQTFWRKSFTTSRIRLPRTNFTTSFINLPTCTNWKLLSFTDLKTKR